VYALDTGDSIDRTQSMGNFVEIWLFIAGLMSFRRGKTSVGQSSSWTSCLDQDYTTIA
jgi:hypothetical protein